MNEIETDATAVVPQVSTAVSYMHKLPSSRATTMTFADLMSCEDYWLRMAPMARSVHKAYLRSAAHIVASSRARAGTRTDRIARSSVVLSTIPVDVEWLNQHLFRYPAAVHGVTAVMYTKALGGLRRVLRHLDLIDPRTPSPLPVGSAWAQLLEKYENLPYVRMSLKGFSSWCHGNDIAPSEVTLQTLAIFEAYLLTRHLNQNVPGVLRSIRNAWRKVSHSLPDGFKDPAFAQRTPARYTLPLEAFPRTYRDDVAALEMRLSGANRKGPFRGDGPKRNLRPSSIKCRLFSLRQAVSALVLMGRRPDTITKLADLVEEKAFEDILTFFWRKAATARLTPEERTQGIEPAPELGVTAQTAAIASALMMVARYHCKLSPARLQPLRDMASDMRPKPQSQLSRKNWDRLRQFDDPVVRAKLLHLPQHLMRLAADVVHPHRAACMARTAIAIEILLHVPMRIGNLAALRLGRNLKLGSGRQALVTHIVLQATMTKNDVDLEWWVSPELAAFINHYLERHRPILAPPGSDYLFPAGFGAEGPLAQETMSGNLNRVIAEKVGAITNPHLFRSLCARLILEHSPGALEDVRLMLGNKTLEVILAHYSPVERMMAGRRADEVLRQSRDGTAHLAQPVILRRRGRPK